MKKILFSLILLYNSLLFGLGAFKTNMDRVKYYDANRDYMDKVANSKELLDKFVNSTATDNEIEDILKAKTSTKIDTNIDMQVDEQEKAKQQKQNKAIQPKKEEKGFFSKMLKMVGLGDDKKQQNEDEDVNIAPTKEDIKKDTNKIKEDVAQDETTQKEEVTQEEVTQENETIQEEEETQEEEATQENETIQEEEATQEEVTQENETIQEE
jgi:hypothetical protein